MNEALLRSAYGHHQAGNLAEAARLYGEVLRLQPGHFDALCMFGLLQAQRGDMEEAARLADAAMAFTAGAPSSWYNLGCLLQKLERHRDALDCYDRALAGRPQYLEALVQRGISSLALRDGAEALTAFDRALEIRPNEAGLWNNRGNALIWLNRLEEAIESYDKAVALKPGYPDAWENRGRMLLGLGRYADALASYDKSLSLRPGSANLLTQRGIALLRLKRHTEALACFNRALAIDAKRADALFYRGNALSELMRYEEALQSLDASLAIEPGNADALVSRGVCLSRLNRTEEALACYDRALALNPNCVEALVNRGTIRFENWQFEEAVRDYEAVLDIAPDIAYIRGNLALYRLNCCDWRHLDEDRMRIESGLVAGKQVVLPFVYTAISKSMASQLRCARLWAKHELPAGAEPLWKGERYDHARIRVAYLSADLHVHATAFLMAGVFEHHDRGRFETIAISYGPDDGSPTRARLRSAFDRFIDVRDKNDLEVASLLRQMEIDIAVDLKGYTQHSRPGILAYRPAPVQVHHLGYPGTMGTGSIDYIVADPVVIPQEHQIYFTEKIAYLPDSYQCNDSKRRIGDTAPTRAEAGLPEDVFVFASFNNSYKIMPEMFAVWMSLLRRNSRAVLWILQYSTAALRNLKREAEAAGVDPERLVFAPSVPHPDHLARMRLADLFLDTLPYNAHTTASDALWAGLPVVTVRGSTFAGRVGASLLRAAGLPELITDSLTAYEELALNLSEDAAALSAIKTKLAAVRTSCPLFDTARFTRNLEAAFEHMWSRAQKGDLPETFDVSLLPVAEAP